MNEASNEFLEQTEENSSASATELRRRRRINLALPARVRPFDTRCGQSEEVRTTVNFTRHGVYFTTWLDHYYLNMRVLVTFPYSEKDAVQREYLGQVVRLEKLEDGSQGVAVQFLF